MSYSDPVADMLTRIRNAQQARKKVVNIRASNTASNIAAVLKDEGYIDSYTFFGEKAAEKIIKVELKYIANSNEPVITRIDRVSRPGLRIYKSKQNLPKVMNGLGIAIVSTSRGVLSDTKARELGIGGEILCLVQ